MAEVKRLWPLQREVLRVLDLRRLKEGRIRTLDVAHDTAREAELDRLITKRHDQRTRSEGERAEQALWKESVKRYHEQRRRENCAAWYAHEMNLCEVHARLSEEHRIRAEELLKDRVEGGR
jgi:hypothetical protein